MADMSELDKLPPALFPLSPHEIREISVRACADPRSVIAILAGKRVRSSCALRIRRAIKDFGREDLLPKEQPETGAK
jgi:hypothetical protein